MEANFFRFMVGGQLITDTSPENPNHSGRLRVNNQLARQDYCGGCLQYHINFAANIKINKEK